MHTRRFLTDYPSLTSHKNFLLSGHPLIPLVQVCWNAGTLQLNVWRHVRQHSVSSYMLHVADCRFQCWPSDSGRLSDIRLFQVSKRIVATHFRQVCFRPWRHEWAFKLHIRDRKYRSPKRDTCKRMTRLYFSHRGGEQLVRPTRLGLPSNTLIVAKDVRHCFHCIPGRRW